MPKTVFSDTPPLGTIVSAAWLNLIQNHRHDGKDADGSCPIDYAVDTGAANAYVATYTPAITAHVIGLPLIFKAVNANTDASTFNPGPGAVAIKRKDGTILQAGDIPAGGMIIVVFDGTYYQLQNMISQTTSILRGYIDGLTMSTTGSSATMAIAAGQAADSNNVNMMTLLNIVNKTTSAWAVGNNNGGLDTGTIAANTWYHFFLIMRPDTGVVDILFSTSASAPVMPANYTLFRRIGSGKTNSSNYWTGFMQTGDYFRWRASVLDINNSSPGTSANTGVLASIPHGVKVKALINAATYTGIGSFYISDLDANDEAPCTTSTLATPIFSWGGQPAASAWNGIQMEVMTNTSAQIRYRTTGGNMAISTLGWTDFRGKNN
ncbi:MAG: hypothetical protein ABSC11_03410 [Smithella sp.]|jgi:hypothetical protein